MNLLGRQTLTRRELVSVIRLGALAGLAILLIGVPLVVLKLVRFERVSNYATEIRFGFPADLSEIEFNQYENSLSDLRRTRLRAEPTGSRREFYLKTDVRIARIDPSARALVEERLREGQDRAILFLRKEASSADQELASLEAAWAQLSLAGEGAVQHLPYFNRRISSAKERASALRERLAQPRSIPPVQFVDISSGQLRARAWIIQLAATVVAALCVGFLVGLARLLAGRSRGHPSEA